MSDAQQPSSRSLSEIGHLFLSSVRQRQTEGSAMPRRLPPNRVAPAAPVAHVAAEPVAPQPVSQPANEDAAVDGARIPPVTAILGSHLNGRQRERVLAYARHLASRGQRVGLIEVDSADFRLTCFESQPDAAEMDAIDPSDAQEEFDARSVAEALEELSWDLDRWLLLLPNVRGWEAKCLLRDVGHWSLLSTCDHDGVISCYRTLKGLNPGGEDWPKPRLSLALFEARDAAEAEKVHRKLSGVCQQFLELPLEAEAPVDSAADGVAEHAVMYCRLSRGQGTDKPQGAIGPHWQVVADFLAKAKSHAAEVPAAPRIAPMAPVTSVAASKTMTVIPFQTQSKTQIESDAMGSAVTSQPFGEGFTMSPVVEGMAKPEPVMPQPAAAQSPVAPMRLVSTEDESSGVSDVVELPEGAATGGAILGAVVRREAGAMIECPLTPPMCPDAKLAVTRDRRLVLLAVTRQGLGDLRAIGRAYQWLGENRNLIAMALPQFAIDAAAQPKLRLLVDHADLSAEILHPLLESATVTVQAYRRLRWGGRNGLLLDAA